MRNLFAWAFGLGAMISLFLVYQQQDRKKLLLCKWCADVCWVVHYVCLGAFGGAIPNFVGIFREMVFTQREKRKWADLPLWPVLFILLNFLLGLRTFSRPVNLLPLTASAFVTISLWLKRPKLTKLISVPVSAAFLIYDVFVASYLGVVNESLALLSILICFRKERSSMKTIFTPDHPVSNEPILIPGGTITNARATITAAVSEKAKAKGDEFAAEIRRRFVADFEKADDQMVHVTTFLYAGGTIYVSYYANTQGSAEDPGFQTARFACCPVSDPQNQTVFDIQTVGDRCYDGSVEKVYDTILMQKDENTLFVLWTAAVSGKYYRLYRTFDLRTHTLGSVQVNRFKVGETVNDFSTTGIQNALTANKIGYKTMFSDIGIMQKLTVRTENGVRYYYTGTYSGAFNAIIKSRDLITWEYVSQPDFINDSKWENAVYVRGDRCYYFVRQFDEASRCGFLTVYDLEKHVWEAPVLIEDCQSRSDFIEYKNELYLFHAPIDREHIGIVRIDQRDIASSEIVLQADMKGSCFYPFVQYADDGGLGMSYTVERKHVRLARFDFDRYL